MIIALVNFGILLTMLTCVAQQEQSLHLPTHPFKHDLGVKIIPAKQPSDELTICCHGYGHNGSIVDIVSSFGILPGTLIGFNFPDHDIRSDADHSTCTHGTPDEIIPLLFLLKYVACDVGLKKINLYGFSAGGGAIINTLAVINQLLHEDKLVAMGIYKEDLHTIRKALEHGLIILDCPLKSLAEIQDARPYNQQLSMMAARYKENNMEPIEALSLLMGLTLSIVVHFQNPDEILTNRDDELFVERLKDVNQGKTWAIFGQNGKHNGYHRELWSFVREYFA